MSGEGRHAVATREAPRAIGPYAQGIAANGLLFCSGQIGLDPATGEMVGGDVGAQTRRCLENLAAVCAAAGAALTDALRMTVYLVDLGDFAGMNEVYGSVFGSAPPARTTIGVRELPLGAQVEMDAIVLLPPRA